MEIVLVFLLWLYVLLQLLVLAGFFSERPKAKLPLKLPSVAILVPARNEAQNITQCLNSLLKLNYPKNLLEIWVGNDSSTDDTSTLIDEFCKKHPHIKKYEVSNNLGTAKAKGNVLAHLVAACQAEYIFVTDADIEVGEDWVKHLLAFLLEPSVGMVSGSTVVTGINYFEKWQGLEWTLGNGHIIGLDRLGLKSTAVGNNMCFTREAYEATGGYQNMPFSVTEDFQLFKAIRAKGYETVNLIEPNSLNFSKAQTHILPLLHQRKRWLQGATGLPWYWMFIFALQALFYPALIALLFVHAVMALKIWAFKVLVQTVFLVLIAQRLRLKIHWPSLILYEPYALVMQFMMMGFYLLPVKMNWKQRRY
jgi:cellulose synthase/poly-beta-1,6-N-acetylglucosamine synthase-like glycosyltransferase